MFAAMTPLLGPRLLNIFLSRYCPFLKQLSVKGMDAPSFISDLPGLVRSLPHLETFICDIPLSSDCINQLAALSGLRTFSTDITTRDALPDNQQTLMPANPFPILQELELRVDVLEAANNFITAVFNDSPIQIVRTEVFTAPSLSDFGKFCSTLLRRFLAISLKEVRLYFPEADEAPVPMLANIHTFYPLFAANNLEVFVIGQVFSCDNDLIEAMATAWPLDIAKGSGHLAGKI
jgi:hypothetical protein